MASPFRTRNAQLHAKIEASFSSVGGADVFVGFNPSFKPNFEQNEDNSFRASFGKYPIIGGGVSADLGFSFHVKGGGTAAVPEYDAALKLCGLKPTGTVYKPDITQNSPGSVSYNADGQLHVIEGAFGNLKISGEAGKLVTATCDFKGAYVDVADVAIVTADVALDATQPVALKGSTLNVMGYSSAVVKSFSIDLGADISLLDDMSTTSAYAGAFYGDRKITGQVVVEAPDIATLDLYTKALNNTSGVMSWQWGTVQYNIVQINVPYGIVSSVVPSDDNGRLILTCDFSASLPGAQADGADFNITIT